MKVVKTAMNKAVIFMTARKKGATKTEERNDRSAFLYASRKWGGERREIREKLA